MQGLPENTDKRMLVGSANADDAGVFKLSDSTALVQTLDFFTPIVDDPYLFGQIAAANSLSDVYAMGGRPITAMAIAGMPSSLPPEMIAEIFRGGADKAKEAECSLVGGHTIKNPEPIYGLSVTGLVHPDHYLSNDQLEAGDIFILTKRLGTGIASSALKSGQCSEELQQLCVDSMVALNTAGAEIADRKLSKACTDVTGFGLLGHLWEMCRASKISAELNCAEIPPISSEVIELIQKDVVPGGSKKNWEAVSEHVDVDASVNAWMPLLLADAQTAGGLLISCKEQDVDDVLAILSKHKTTCSAVIGKCTESAANPRIKLI